MCGLYNRDQWSWLRHRQRGSGSTPAEDMLADLHSRQDIVRKDYRVQLSVHGFFKLLSFISVDCIAIVSVEFL